MEKNLVPLGCQNEMPVSINPNTKNRVNPGHKNCSLTRLQRLYFFILYKQTIKQHNVKLK